MTEPNQPAAAPAAAPGAPQQPSILFACASNILDITSGAASSMRTLLASLAAHGFRAVALQATIFDSPQGGEHVFKAGEGHKDKAFLRTIVHGVEHLIVQTKASFRPHMTSREEEIFIDRFRYELRERRPDMIILWGGMLLEMTMMREAREAGIPVVFYLVNGGYKNKATFKYVSTIVTDTEATAALYKERLGLTCHVIGKFVDPGQFVAPQRKPDYITFINPSWEKGVNVFMPLARMALQELPQARFLVVQSRGRWGNALKALGYAPEDFPNVKVIGHQKDMRVVYGETRVLLLPSLWHESGARVIAEALLNGIPVLSSDGGGSAELAGSAGKTFTIPEEVRNKRDKRAPDEVARPWLEEIKRLIEDEAYYSSMVEAARKESARHDMRGNTQRFIAAVSPVVLESKGIKLAAPAPAPATMESQLAVALKKKQARQATRKSKLPKAKA